MDKLYNEQTKERYLEERFSENEDSQKTIRHLFYKSELIEDILQKDLYNFNLEEIGKVIQNANPHSKSVAVAYGRAISSYIKWAIKNYLRDDNIHPMRKSVTLDWYEQFVDKTKKVHYSFDEFIVLLESLKNDQDKAFLFCMFEGIIGRSFSQVRELKIADIKKDTNEIYVKERDEWIKVNPKCIDYLFAAIDQKFFYTYKDGDYNESELLTNESYVFKNLKSPRSVQGQQINPSVLYSRLNSIKESHKLEYLTPNAIKQSGMIYMAVQLFKEYGILKYEQRAEIGEKYEFNKLKSGDTEYYNSNLMKQFLNEDSISELYGINVIIENR